MTFPTRLEPTSNAADWESETVELFDADTGTDVENAGLTLALEVVSPTGQVAVTATTADRVTTSGNAFWWIIPAAVMRQIRPDTYAVYVRATDPVSGDVDQLLATQIQIYEGGFR
jgi:hypothetical protein